ncbi:hypothetical protein SAMN05216463_12352 [Xylanibacter ruminicola]|uniref:Uncharacterized protein n=1 Tax=Xylanibacter ruminicola TaxID=839 RepID=A0A1M6Y1J2_XYLRU|nr:hypothetical protein SAMN05216463_12352 [Xylanibacter ruminicola]
MGNAKIPVLLNWHNIFVKLTQTKNKNPLPDESSRG